MNSNFEYISSWLSFKSFLVVLFLIVFLGSFMTTFVLH